MEINPETTMNILNEYRENGAFYDVTFSVGGQIFRCHKAVLIANVEYFRVMFKENFKECHDDVIPMNNCDESTFSSFLDYMYTGKIILTIDTIVKLLSFASYIIVNPLIKKCELFIENCLQDNVQNSVSLLIEAIEMKLCKMQETIISFMQPHFEEISENELIFKIPQIQFLMLTSKYRSKHTFCTILKWIAFDVESRSQYMSSLLKNMRLQFINNKLVSLNTAEVSDYKQIMCVTSSLLYSLLFDTFDDCTHEIQIFGISSENGCILSQQYANSCIQPIDYIATHELNAINLVATKLFYRTYIHYKDARSENYSFQMFDNAFGESWTPLQTLNGNFLKLVSCEKTDCIYGYTFERKGFDFYAYVSDIDQWIQISSFSNTNKSIFKVPELTVHNNIIYSFGIDEDKCNQYQKYDSRIGTWSNIHSAPFPIHNRSASVLHNSIYLCGTYENRTTLLQYDVTAGKWNSDCSGMKYNRGRWYNLVTYMDNLYAIGGNKSLEGNQVIEIYNPKQNVWKDDVSLENITHVSAVVF